MIASRKSLSVTAWVLLGGLLSVSVGVLLLLKPLGEPSQSQTD